MFFSVNSIICITSELVLTDCFYLFIMLLCMYGNFWGTRKWNLTLVLTILGVLINIIELYSGMQQSYLETV